MFHLACLFSDLSAAAHTAKHSRLRIVICAAVCEDRLIFAAAFFVAHGTPLSAWPPATATGLVLFSWIRALLALGSDLLQSRWRWSPQQAQLLYANRSLVVAPDPSVTPGPLFRSPPPHFLRIRSTGVPSPGRTRPPYVPFFIPLESVLPGNTPSISSPTSHWDILLRTAAFSPHLTSWVACLIDAVLWPRLIITTP